MDHTYLTCYLHLYCHSRIWLPLVEHLVSEVAQVSLLSQRKELTVMLAHRSGSLEEEVYRSWQRAAVMLEARSSDLTQLGKFEPSLPPVFYCYNISDN